MIYWHEPMLQTCRKCGETKDLTEFHKDPQNKLGVSYTCKVCANSRSKGWRTANMEKHLRTKQEWEAQHPSRMSAYKHNHKAYKRGYLKCSCCTKEDLILFLEKKPEGYEVDHVVPAKAGGYHCVANIQFLPRAEHLAKSADERANYRVAKERKDGVQ